MPKLEKSQRYEKRKSIFILRLIKLSIFVGSIIIFGYAFDVSSGSGSEAASAPPPESEPEIEMQAKDYSRFSHSNQFHSRLPCLLCHRRDDNSARLRLPGRDNHLPCAGCHALQFSDQSSPICTICHTDSQSGAMKRFPRLKSFGMKFEHARHTRVNCATCHKSEGRGVAKSIPSGQSAHTTCFQCHTNQASFSMSSCSVCHQQGRLIRTSENARSFRLGFSHSKHDGVTNLNCSSCHRLQPRAGRGRQMSNPLPSMHFAPARALSCGSCHDGNKAFGPNDFSNCKRCHNGNSFRF